MMKFHVILACTLACGIGKDGGIPWRIPADMQHFRTITTKLKYGHSHIDKQNMVIMGRKTWESLPRKPLYGRKNVVVTQQNIDGVSCVSSLDAALSLAENDASIDHVFVIGGAQLYNEALAHPCCDTVYITMVNWEYDCDTFFDSTLLKRFEMKSLSEVETYQKIEYAFAVFAPFSESD